MSSSFCPIVQNKVQEKYWNIIFSCTLTTKNLLLKTVYSKFSVVEQTLIITLNNHETERIYA